MGLELVKQSDCKSTMFAHMVSFFVHFDQELQYPQCEGREDAKRIIAHREKLFHEMLQHFDK